MTVYLDIEDLLEIATVVLDRPPDVRDHGLLSSSAVRPMTVVFGREAYPDLWHKAAALLHSVAMNHALVDGNKRLAWSAARVFLSLNGVPWVKVDVDAAEQFVLDVVAGRLSDVADVAGRLRQLLT